MGGDIRAQSTVGEGSKFTVDLCLPVAQETSPTRLASRLLDGVRALVVDDNATNREILQQQLHGWGMAVTCAAGGEEALRSMRTAAQAHQPFELAVIDMHIPEMDGLQLAHEIKSLPLQAATKLLMLSSTYADNDQSARNSLGIQRYLNKPVRRSDLFRVICEILADAPLDCARPPPSTQDAGAHAGRRVLLVEDSPINQYIAAEMLKKLGFEVSVAANGAQAVARVRELAYDLVLMDCQMPQMDGFTATRLIRAWEGGAPTRPLPIIALTANAMTGDRHACLAAGMSDYLAKPFSSAGLAEIVARHLSDSRMSESAVVRERAAADTTATSPNGDDAPPPLPVFDPALLQSLPMVADRSKPEFVDQVLEQFREVSRETLTLYEQAGRAGDYRTQLRCVHTLKSSSAQIGLKALAAVAEDLEHSLRGGGRADVDGVSRLQAAHRRALEAIAAHLGDTVSRKEHPAV